MTDRNENTIGAGWALVFPASYDRRPIVDCGRNVDEARIWEIGLGWPIQSEIDCHRKRGVRAVRVRVVEDTDA